MSRSATYEFAVAVNDLPHLARALERFLVAGTQAGEAPVQDLAARLDALAQAPTSSICLTFEFEPDDPLRAFRSEHPDIEPATPGRIAVGCFWTSAWRDADAVRVALVSAAGVIAELMQASASVRRAFVGAAAAGRAVLEVVDEWEGRTVLREAPTGTGDAAS